MKRIERIKEFGGWLERYEHESDCCNCMMTFSIFLPPQVQKTSLPSLYWLSGLTCTDDNFRVKAGAQRYASELGIVLIIPDTSPRGDHVPDEPERYDIGKGAGFYIGATEAPWCENYQMYDYITVELPALIEKNFPVVRGLKSISGHSMGGHGALICALKEPEQYRSVSAFSPICHPIASAWGKQAFSCYLGENTASWNQYDATELVKAGCQLLPTLIDQGTDDEFLAEQLFPQDLQSAYKMRGVSLNLRLQVGYDHSYHFVASFIGEHIAFHVKALQS